MDTATKEESAVDDWHPPAGIGDGSSLPAGAEVRPVRPPTGRRIRWLRGIGRTVAALVVIGLAGITVLLVSTPGVGDAERRAADLDRAHQVAYPGAPVAPRFAAALIATENSRFYSTPGIDPISLARAAAGLVTGHGDSGGATLEQQLAKQLYTGGHEGGLATKAEQAALAIKLDVAYTKSQILQMYCAVVYFGHGYWGLTAASRGYFGRSPQELSWGQAAMLAGLVQAPSAYDPLSHPDLARARQHHVLDRLVVTGQLSAADAAAAEAEATTAS